MRKIILLTTGVLLLIAFSLTARAADPFSDIQFSEYRESIIYLHDEGIVQGYEDGTYRPDSPINRAEMLKIILTATEQDETIGDRRECFTDVRIAWYARFVCFAKNRGIVKGYSDGRFRPAQEVNMVEGLKMAMESFDLNLDEAAGELWYEPYTEFAHENNLFSKFSYFPGRSMTRGEMSYLIHRLILNDKVEKPFTGQRSNLSAGCGTIPPGSPPTRSAVSGVTRHYITVIPKDYDKDEPKKLIFAFHGRTNPNTQVRGYYKVEQAAGNEAIMIYPAGLPEEGPSRSWSDPGNSADNLRDYALFDQLLAEFSQNYCIDLDEVYVVGHSLGAWFTNSLGCARGDVIRGIGTLGGGISAGTCSGPVATWISHNPNDRLAPFSSGIAARDTFLRNNQCSGDTKAVAPSSMNCAAYQGCFEHAPVVWCPHTINYDNRGTYYPHTWPRGTGEAIWNFFESLE
jgi:polyhydroxybutyrate depolymerase